MIKSHLFLRGLRTGSNYAVEQSVLVPHVPRGVELDLWEGEALVSMVGFRFLKTRVLRMPIPFHQNFDEVNLRFYVRRRTGIGWERGVVFVREFVPRFAIAAVARLFYNEPYLSMPMRHRVPASLKAGDELNFEWRFRGRWHGLGATLAGEPQMMTTGSAEEFIFEHYQGYTRQRDGSTIAYQVEHPPWKVWQTSGAYLDADIAALYGAEFVPALRAPPRSAFVAEGSEILVRGGARVPEPRKRDESDAHDERHASFRSPVCPHCTMDLSQSLQSAFRSPQSGN